MVDTEISPEMRDMMRGRIAAFEVELRQDQAFCEPSHAGYRVAVPFLDGVYTDEQIDRIIGYMREAAKTRYGVQASHPENLLSQALQRFNLE